MCSGVAPGTHIQHTFQPTPLVPFLSQFPALSRRIAAGAVRVTPLAAWQTLHLAAPEDLGGYAYSVTGLPLADHCAGGWGGLAA